MKRVNLSESDWDHERERPGWQWRALSVGRRLGGAALGGTLYVLDPGQRTFPYHYHHAVEEWLIVLEGAPTLRDPDGEHPLEPGDIVLFERGPAGAHQLRNDTDTPCRLLMISSMSDVEVVKYPDSGKVGSLARTPGAEWSTRLFVRESDGVDYFDGED